MAILVSFLAGGCIVLSRTINAILASHTSALKATLINNLVGTFSALCFFAISGEWVSASFASIGHAPWYAFLGGVLGIGVVFLSNVTTLKIPAFMLTLLIFSAQLMTGMSIDVLLGRSIKFTTLAGALLILAGLAVQMKIEAGRNQASIES